MGREKYTIVVKNISGSLKLFKILFSRDGSFHVAFPYLPYKEIQLTKYSINYAKETQTISFEEIIDAGKLEDEDSLKLSHHRSGFVQFSGKGILSGVDQAGNIKGIGVQSWPLDRPVGGPAFSVLIREYTLFPLTNDRAENIWWEYRASEDLLNPTFLFEGFFFLKSAEKHTFLAPDGRKAISFVHPQEGEIVLAVLEPPSKFTSFGFIGIRVRVEEVENAQTPFNFSVGGHPEISGLTMVIRLVTLYFALIL